MRATVVRLRQVDGAILVAAKPKVWTPELVNSLRALNAAIRWLREHDLTPLSVDLFAVRPTIVVRPIAAGFLITEAHGVNTSRLPDGERLCSVVILGCAIQWRTLAVHDEVFNTPPMH